MLNTIQNASSHRINWTAPAAPTFTQFQGMNQIDPGASIQLDCAVVAASRAADPVVAAWFNSGALVILA